MTAFIVFAGLNYYPSGGAGDIWGYAETLSEAHAEAYKSLQTYDWSQILDLSDQTYVDVYRPEPSDI